MSVAVNSATEFAVQGGPLASTPTAIGVIVLALLALILIEREILRIARRGSTRSGMRALDLAAAPLLTAGAGLLGLRFLDILGTL